MTNCTISHNLVNNGTVVILYNVGISYGWKNLNNADPSEGMYDITPCQKKGFENPKIVLSGVIDVHDIDTNDLTQTHLVNFATLRSTTPIVLTCATGTAGYYLKGRPSGGYTTSGTNTLSNSFNVIIDDFSLVPDESSEQSHIWRYSINLTETRSV